MEEAERLWDRVAVIDGGRVVATDTPAGLTLTRADDDSGTPMTRDSQEPPAAGTNKASPPPGASSTAKNRPTGMRDRPALGKRDKTGADWQSERLYAPLVSPARCPLFVRDHCYASTHGDTP